MFENIPLVQQIPADLRFAIARILGAIAVFMIFWLLRHVVAGFVLRPLRRRVEKTAPMLDDRLFGAVEDASSWIVLGLATFISLPILDAQGGLHAFLINLGLSLITIGVLKFFYDLAGIFTKSQQRFASVFPVALGGRLIPLVRVSVRMLITIIGLVFIAQLWGMNLAGLITGLGLVGLALSLAAKEVLDDVIAFATIISDDVFKLNEYIVSEHAEGTVERIGIRATRVRQLNQGLVTVPNSKFTSDPVTNWSRLSQRWFNFMVGLTYQTTANQIEDFVSAVRRMLQRREAVQDDSVVVLFVEYDSSALNILIRSYISIADWTEAKAERHAVNLEIMRLLKSHELEIAYPTRSLYLEDVPLPIAESFDADTEFKQVEMENLRHNGHHKRNKPPTGRQFSRGDADYDQDLEGSPEESDGGEQAEQ